MTINQLITKIGRQRVLTALSNVVCQGGSSGGSGVTSFNGRTGIVVPAQADYDSFFLTPAEGNAAYQPLDSDLTAIAALVTQAFGRSLLTQATAAAARVTLGGLPFILYKNHTPASLTATTNETVMDTGLLIGAATLGPTDTLRISIIATKVGANGTLTIRLRCGTAGTVADAQIATFATVAGNLYVPFKREITFASLVSQKIYPTASAAVQDNAAVSNSGFDLTIDFSTLANYIMPTFQLSSGADAVNLRSFEVEVIRNS